MSQHIGVDIIEIDRIKKASSRWGDKFLCRVFTPLELLNYRHKLQSLTARFAAKEAIFKALGAYDLGISWQDIEVLATSDGKPTVELRGKAQTVARKLAVNHWEISLSHSGEYAVAFVLGSS